MQLKILISCIFFFLSSMAFALPIIVLDSGHEPSLPGAWGTCHKNELIYNDELVQEISQTLSKSYKIILTRNYGQDVELNDLDLTHNLPSIDNSLLNKHKSLYARAAIANLNHAQIFISIHHDSTSLKQQIKDPMLCGHKGGVNLKSDFKNKYKIGYNIFINNSDSTQRKLKSLQLAEDIGKQMLAMNRIPSSYHVFPVDKCKSCYPINKNLGVWHDNLAVLKYTTMPAVLIEVGNIVDPEDEKIINSNNFRVKFSKALNEALNEYFVE